jgi:hypothetical protein
MAKKQGFTDIFEELTWEMCKLSNGNPYIFEDLVQGRNAEREKSAKEKSATGKELNV